MKTISLLPVNKKPQINTNDRILDALLAEQVDVLMACGGRGRCATCHVYVEGGADCLTPPTQREIKTLGRVSQRGQGSRLACQARVIKEGVQVRLPQGMYVHQGTNVEALIGKRAQSNILHPITGEVLVEEGKLVTRTFIMKLQDVQVDLERLRGDVDEA